MKWEKLYAGLGVALLLSLVLNGWLLFRANRDSFYIRQGLSFTANAAVYWLDGLIKVADDPNADWDDPGFRTGLVQSLDGAMHNAQATGSVMSGLVTGPRWQVAAGLNWLGMALPGSASLAAQVASNPDPFPTDQKALLQGLVAKLKAAGFPRSQVDRDDDQGWAQLAAVLQKLQQSGF
ncbi:MAG: hypothetical protein ACM3XM_03450 [Mycobacterium leprae]